MKNILVMYHAGCNDGIASAWVAHKQFGDEAEYMPWQYNDPLPDMKGRWVFLLDLSISKDQIEAVKEDVNFLVILDHHKSAIEELAGHYTEVRSYGDLRSTLHTDPHRKIFTWLDKTFSGATMTWHFFNTLNPDSQGDVPEALELIEDYDLWKHEYRNTRAFNAWLGAGRRTIERFNEAVQEDGTVKPDVLEAGKTLLAYDNRIVHDITRSYVNEVTWRGLRVATVNCPAHLRNDVGDGLVNDYDMVVCYTVRQGKVVYSLRSSGSVDVSAVAKEQGGGGHAAAAAFSIPLGLGNVPGELVALQWLSETKPTFAQTVKSLFNIK